ncbi:MAG: hypothetical protein P9L91_10610 [Candidatus Zophobacter franzmannii]|nr:hypothetical protein [Candidatus Zophobacter franzmannii]
MKKQCILFILLFVFFQLILADTHFLEDFSGTTFPPTGLTAINVQGSQQWQRITYPSHSAPLGLSSNNRILTLLVILFPRFR